MTRIGVPLTRIERPSAARSPSKRRRKSSCERIAVRSPAVSSSGLKKRPAAGATPSVGKKLAVARPTRTTSSSAPSRSTPLLPV